MSTVRDILRLKGNTAVASITPDVSVFEAAVQMTERGIGSLVVRGDDGRLVGILTERDVLSQVVARRRDPLTTPAEDVMTTEVICCRPHTSLEEARGAMKNRRIRHLPVLSDEEELVGLVSIGDLNAFQSQAHEETIYLLQEYIAGRV